MYHTFKGFRSNKKPSVKTLVKLYALFKTQDPENQTLFSLFCPTRLGKLREYPSPPRPPREHVLRCVKTGDKNFQLVFVTLLKNELNVLPLTLKLT